MSAVDAVGHSVAVHLADTSCVLELVWANVALTVSLFAANLEGQMQRYRTHQLLLSYFPIQERSV